MELNMTQHDFDLIRDLHKEARGRRPSYDWDVWFAALPLAEKQEVWNDLVAESNKRDAEEASAEQWHCREFRDAIRATMRAGAPSVDDALSWLYGYHANGVKPYSVQDIEHWVWDNGILFTPLGKAVVQRLDAITDYKEW
jgi:hypothetical protein